MLSSYWLDCTDYTVLTGLRQRLRDSSRDTPFPTLIGAARVSQAVSQGLRTLPSAQTGANEVAVHARDHFELDFFRAHGFAFADVGATAEEFLFGLRHHGDGALGALRPVSYTHLTLPTILRV